MSLSNYLCSTTAKSSGYTGSTSHRDNRMVVKIMCLAWLLGVDNHSPIKWSGEVDMLTSFVPCVARVVWLIPMISVVPHLVTEDGANLFLSRGMVGSNHH